MLEKLSSFSYPKEVFYITDKLLQNNYQVYLVGGCIRDILLNKSPKDFDFTTNCKVSEIVKLFRRTILTGIKHGTVTILKNQKQYEITTFRKDGAYVNNRHPSCVSFTNSLLEDLSRRDFSINALCFNPISQDFVDGFFGLQDLEKKIVKAINNPQKRFEEDALRMLRAIRFSAKLGFEIESKTFFEIVEKSHLLNNISKERIRDEFEKILRSRPSYGIKMLKLTNLIKYILPYKLDDNIVLKSKNYWINLCYILQNQDHKKVLFNLKFSNKTIKKVDDIIKIYKFLDDYDLIIMIDNLKNHLYLNLIFHKKYDDLKGKIQYIFKKKYPISLKDLPVNGNDLKKLDFKGAQIGLTLKKLHKYVVLNYDQKYKNKEEVLTLLKKIKD